MGENSQTSPADVRNFDTEFTQLPALITPDDKTAISKALPELSNFSYIAGNHLNLK